MRAFRENETIRRVDNVTSAIHDSFPRAFGDIEAKLGGISVASIAGILRDMLKDVAIILGGSTALGTGIGAAIGVWGFGVGAIPGAGVGAAAGFETGNLILTITGLKSIVSFMKDAVPGAMNCYAQGFRKAWGESDGSAPYKNFAYSDFAQGHVLFVLAILAGIVGYIMRKGDFPLLMNEMRASPRLGPKFADWVGTNKDALMRNPILMQSMRSGAGAGAAEAEAPRVVQGPMRGQTPPNLIDPYAPISGPAVTPTQAAPPQNVWSMRPWTRGRVIEDNLAQTDYADWYHVGAENNGYFPLVDFQNGNSLASLKTIDTNGATWMTRTQQHIVDLQESGSTVNGNLADLFLDIRVQPGGAQAAQPLIKYGEDRGINVTVTEYP
jgi:hypothetical protein